MNIKYFTILLLSLCFFNVANAANDTNVDCLILEDENSIICKYIHERVDVDTNITVQWIEANHKITRQRDMIIPASHGSVYDYRYLKGRSKGIWTFKVIDNGDEYKAHFTIE